MVKLNKRRTILVTGSAGFIGYHLSKRLTLRNFKVIGIDNLNNYYDVKLKKDRIKNIYSLKKKNFKFYKIDLSNINLLRTLFKKYKFDYVINLAAQAGVRYSLKKPRTYIKSNINGFFNLIEISKEYNIKHFIYASTSSIYGKNKITPFKESLRTDEPLQLYAATKKSNELFAHSYSYLYNIPTTGLRFFTVYGPWGRPDMALFIFVKKILLGNKIDVYNYGNHIRDFTYIDDIVNGIEKLIFKIPKSSKAFPPFRILNIGNSKPIKLLNFIKEIEFNLNRTVKKNYLPLQKGDVIGTHSDTSKIKKLLNYRSKINYKTGIKRFINWYLNYFKINIK